MATSAGQQKPRALWPPQTGHSSGNTSQMRAVCLAALGVPAKTVINQRLVLEAKRLLAHTSMAVQTIGRELGLEEATNFVKFCREETQMPPLVFRASQLRPGTI